MTLKISIPPLSIIVAVDQECGFGKDGKIPWHFPDDMKHFKEVTKNSICIMGRRTFEDMQSMIKKPKKIKSLNSDDEKPDIEKPIAPPILVNRKSFVVTSDPNYKAPGATVVKSIRDAIYSLDETDLRQIFVIGGYRMFIEALSWTKLIYMTVIKNKKYNCDRHFPLKVLKQFRIIKAEQTNNLQFLTYARN